MQGVTCGTAGRVVEVAISSAPLWRGGSATANSSTRGVGRSLGDLKALRSVSIYRLTFNAPLPPQWGSLSNLTALNVQETNFIGKLPRELGRLRRLESLQISGNNFQNSAIPSEVWDLPNLRYLDLNGNHLGALGKPSCVPCIAALKTLVLYSNKFTGRIPAWIAGLESLESLSLMFNELTGDIPPELGSLRSLESLELETTVSGAPLRPSSVTSLAPKCSRLITISSRDPSPASSAACRT